MYSIKVPGYANDVEIAANMAYVSTDSGLAVFDISNPAKAVLRTFIPLEGDGRELTLLNGFAYVTGGYSGVSVIDLSIFRLSGHFLPSGNSWGYVWGASGSIMTSSGLPLLAVATLEGVQFLELSTPHAPKHINEFIPYSQDSTGDCHIPYYADTASFLMKTDDVVIKGNHAYVLYIDTECIMEHTLWLRKVNISDPSKPLSVHALPLQSLGCALAVSDDYAYVTHHTGLEIIDIRSAQMRKIVSSTIVKGGEDIVIEANKAYIAAGYNGIAVIDISCPASPKLCHKVVTPGRRAFGIALHKGYIYVADGKSGLTVIGEQ